MTTPLNKLKFKPVIAPEESIDDALENKEGHEEPCPDCKGDGITFRQDINDEEDKDFGTCETCGGSGIDPESQTTDTFLDED